MNSELRTIREQMHSDFKSVMAALAVQRDSVAEITRSMAEIARRLEAITATLTSQQELLGGYMERTEERFDRIVTMVEALEDWRVTVDDRLDALERRVAG